MSWFFDGLGTFLVGLVLGAGADRLFIMVSQRKKLSQSQKAGHFANQMQVGHDFRRPSDGD